MPRTISRRRPETVDELRAGLSGGSFGKGSTAEQGEASALMEAIERYSGIFQGDEIRVTRRFTDFPPGDAIPPNDVLLFSDAQYRGEASGRAIGSDDAHGARRFRSIGRDRMVAGLVAARRALQISSDQPAVFFLQRARRSFHADSNGCAAGNTLEEAIVQGFLELVERDAYAIWWYNRLQRPEVDLGQFDDSYVRDLQTQLAETGRRLWVLDVTSDLGDSDLCRDLALDAKRAGKYRVRLRRAFRSAHRHAAHADRAQSIPVDRSHGRRNRREIEPRRRHSVAAAGPSLSDAERQAAGPAGLGSNSAVSTRASR